ncbi:hypothetical protein CBR_g8063 [Chara braunii]|uniref:Protein kinase domain-containing protein n=1 Tax=Chara braunii TaxID=69332 RepID=A0A388KL45_CHABU|nr:hypothetical protein CBR_g8063 [Chara braunii]|eukprot:GBG70765.1 hypothetical protein CBR_g8063 [Chara braunii]
MSPRSSWNGRAKGKKKKSTAHHQAKAAGGEGSDNANTGPSPVNEESKVELNHKFERTRSDILGNEHCSVYLPLDFDVHPQKPWILFAADHKSFQVWNYEDGTRVGSWQVPEFEGHYRKEARFVAQKEWIVVLGKFDFIVYETKRWNLVRVKVLEGPNTWGCRQSGRRLAVHRSATCILTSFSDGSMALWDWDREWKKITFQERGSDHVAFHPTNANIFASASGQKIKLWDVKKQSVLKTLHDEYMGLTCSMEFCSRVKKPLLISAHHYSDTRVWDYNTGDCIAKLEGSGTRSAFFHPQLPLIFTVGFDRIRIWTESSHQPVLSTPWFGIVNVAACKNSNLLVVGGIGEFSVVDVVATGEFKEGEEKQRSGDPVSATARETKPAAEVLDMMLEEALGPVEQTAGTTAARVLEGASSALKTAIEALEGEAENANKEFGKRIESVALTCREAFDKLREDYKEKEIAQAKRLQRFKAEVSSFNGGMEVAKRLVESNQRIWQLEAEKFEMEEKLQSTIKDLEKRVNKEIAAEEEARLREYSFKEILDATDMFNAKRKRGNKDHEGCTYRGKLRNDTSVLAKVMRGGNLRPIDHAKFKTELVDRLRMLRHPHLLTLLGFCAEENCLVFEDVANGSLQEWIACGEGHTRGSLSWDVRFRVMAEVAQAMSFLHSNPAATVGPIIHRAIKPANILLDEDFAVKISELDQALLCGQEQAEGVVTRRSSMRLSLGNNSQYTAPESLRSGVFDEKTDVYSLGMTMLEMLTGKLWNAFGIVEGVIDSDAAFRNVLDPSAGTWDVDLARQVANLGLSCASLDRHNRPDMTGSDCGILPVLERVVQKAKLAASSGPRARVASPSRDNRPNTRTSNGGIPSSVSERPIPKVKLEKDA